MFLIQAALACLMAAQWPEPWRPAVEAARQAPAGLGADLLIRLAASPKVRERTAKRELLEEAFRLAKGAEYPSAIEGESLLAEALSLGLSRIGLQARVVRRMIAISPVLAVRLFRGMEKPDTRTLACGATTVPSWAEYHAAFQEVLRGADPGLLETQIQSIRSPEELEPLAERIRAGEWTGLRFQQLAGAYGAALGQVDAGPLAFRRAAGFGLQQQIFDLTRRIVKNGGSPRLLIEAWRGFLVRHLGGVRCDGPEEVFERMVAAFNESLLDLGGSRGAVAPIAAAEIRPSRVEGPRRRPPPDFPRRLPVKVDIGQLSALPPGLEWRLRLERFLTPRYATELERSGNALLSAYAKSID